MIVSVAALGGCASTTTPATPPSDAPVVMSEEFSFNDSLGYPWTVRIDLTTANPVSDQTSSPPGTARVAFAASGELTLTNASPDRKATPAGLLPFAVVIPVRPGSALCNGSYPYRNDEGHPQYVDPTGPIGACLVSLDAINVLDLPYPNTLEPGASFHLAISSTGASADWATAAAALANDVGRQLEGPDYKEPGIVSTDALQATLRDLQEPIAPLALQMVRGTVPDGSDACGFNSGKLGYDVIWPMNSGPDCPIVAAK